MSVDSGKKERLFRLGSIVIVALVLFSIIHLRASGGKEVYMNGESYYNLRMARELSQDPFLEQDSIQDATYYKSAYHYTLALIIIWFGEQKMAYFAPILFGVLFALCYAWLLSSLGFSRNNASFTALLLIVTPAFLISFSTLSQAGFTALISLIVLSLYFEKSYWDYPWKASGKLFFGMSIFFLALLAVTSLVGLAVTLVLMAFLSAVKKRGLGSLLFAATPAMLALVPLAIFTNFIGVEWQSMGFQLFNIKDVFSIFGADLGLGLFLLLLFFTGLIIMWRLLKKLRIYHLLSLLLVASSFFNPLLRVYASLIILVYAAIAIKHLYYTKWELDVVKQGTVILLLCALVFSSLSQITAIVQAEPSAPAIEAMGQLANEQPGIVFSSPDYGFYIQEASGKRTYLDGNSGFRSDFGEKLEKYSALLGASRIKDAEPLLNETGISYFFITPAMKEEIWGGKEKGLLLLLKNSAKFSTVYSDSEGFEIWSYDPEA